MFPIQLDLSRLKVVAVGNGAALARRLALLDEDGARDVTLFAPAPSPELADAAGARLRRRLPEAADLAGAAILFAADLPEAELQQVVATARAAGLLVHVEDRSELSTVHAPAVLRRGDLVIAVSTNGKSPGLAGRLRRFLGEIFGPEWQDRLDLLARRREAWRESGAAPAEIRRWTDAWIEREGWLDAPAPAARLRERA